jgi:hypothetical protein
MRKREFVSVVAAMSPTINDVVDVIEPSIKNNRSILFFTGGSNIMTHEIYSNFLNKLTKYNNTIYIAPFKYDNYDELFNYLANNYEETVTATNNTDTKEKQ